MVQIPSQKLTPHMDVHTLTCMFARAHYPVVSLPFSPLPNTGS